MIITRSSHNKKTSDKPHAGAETGTRCYTTLYYIILFYVVKSKSKVEPKMNKLLYTCMMGNITIIVKQDIGMLSPSSSP